MYSQSTQNHPPLPHQPQAHFYGAPELDFGVGKRDSTRRAGGNLCCKFDKVASDEREGFGNLDNVLLLGVDHGLEVFHVDKKRFDRIGRLSGLRGSVIAAKIVPPNGDGPLRPQQPLVIVIIHGPHMTEAATGEANFAENDEADTSISVMQGSQGNDRADPNLYETSVEVYSLKTGLHIQTLFRSPTVEVEVKPYEPPSVPLPVGDLEVQARGKFIVVSCGKSGEVYIFENMQETATSPQSFRCIGKVWTQTNSKVPSRSTSMSSASDSGAPGLHEGLTSELRQLPHADVSLSSRWLAIIPPASSTQITLHGVVADKGSSNKIHGVSSHTSPTEPPVTCQLDTPEAESYLNKAVRDASQTFIKGARWVGDQGMQAWNNYWKPEQTSPVSSPPVAPPPNQYQFPPTHAQDSKIKPPRNTTSLVSILDLEKLSKSQNQKTAVALQPLATFSLPNGCSFVSFSPDGLKLLTASTKGDVQQVWDLMRMVHGDAVRFKDQNPLLRGPTVREVARFPRMTEAKITDVIWTEPRGSRLAILTAKGTAHIFDIPQKAFQWPPPRQVNRDPKTASKPKDTDEEDAPRPQTASSSLSSAFGVLSSTTSSTIAAVRGRRPNSVTSFSTSFGGFAGAGAQSGKAVAAGVNRSVSAAAVGAYDTLRHLGENRVTLPISATEGVLPGSIHWLDGATLGVTAGGLIRIYGISRSSGNPKTGGGSGGGGKRRPCVLSGKPTEFAIPRDSASSLDSHGNRHFTAPTSNENGSTHPAGSFWRPTSPPPSPQRPSSSAKFQPTDPSPPPPSTAAPAPNRQKDHPLDYAEITTSAAYQPFHTDRRVSFYVYNHPLPSSPSPPSAPSQPPQPPPPSQPSTASNLLNPAPPPTTTKQSDPHHLHPTPQNQPMWLFGEPIPRTRVGGGTSGSGLSSRRSPRGGGEGSDADDDDDDDGGKGNATAAAGDVARTEREGEDGEGGVVVTSPPVGRKRRKGRGAGGVAGGVVEEVEEGDGGYGDGEEGEIFEDDVQWVDFTEERV